MGTPALRFKDFEGDWHIRCLKDLANKITDGTHDTPKPVSQGVPYLTAIHIKDGRIDYKSCYYLPANEHQKIFKRCNPEKGDLLMVNIGAGTATCAINTVDYEFSLKNVALIKPNRNLIYPEFLAQYLRKATTRLFSQLTTGGAQPFLSLNQIGKIRIAIPLLTEQTKIANFLTALDEKITQLTQKYQLLNQYKKGVMQKIFSQELRFKDSDGGKFPDWEYKSISTIFLRRSHASKTKFIEEGGKFFIVDMGSIGRDASLISTKTTNYADDFLTTNDLVMAKDDIGGGNIIGRVIKISEDNKYICGDHVYKLSLRENLGCIDYYYFAINSYEVNKSFRKKANGTAQIGISINTVDEQSIPVPCIKEQTKIANFLTAIDEKIISAQSQLELVKQYKQGLLQQMFV